MLIDDSVNLYHNVLDDISILINESNMTDRISIIAIIELAYPALSRQTIFELVDREVNAKRKKHRVPNENIKKTRNG